MARRGSRAGECRHSMGESMRAVDAGSAVRRVVVALSLVAVLLGAMTGLASADGSVYCSLPRSTVYTEGWTQVAFPHTHRVDGQQFVTPPLLYSLVSWYPASAGWHSWYVNAPTIQSERAYCLSVV